MAEDEDDVAPEPAPKNAETEKTAELDAVKKAEDDAKTLPVEE